MCFLRIWYDSLSCWNVFQSLLSTDPLCVSIFRTERELFRFTFWFLLIEDLVFLLIYWPWKWELVIEKSDFAFIVTGLKLLQLSCQACAPFLPDWSIFIDCLNSYLFKCSIYLLIWDLLKRLIRNVPHAWFRFKYTESYSIRDTAWCLYENDGINNILNLCQHIDIGIFYKFI